MASFNLIPEKITDLIPTLSIDVLYLLYIQEPTYPMVTLCYLIVIPAIFIMVTFTSGLMALLRLMFIKPIELCIHIIQWFFYGNYNTRNTINTVSGTFMGKKAHIVQGNTGKVDITDVIQTISKTNKKPTKNYNFTNFEVLK